MFLQIIGALVLVLGLFFGIYAFVTSQKNSDDVDKLERDVNMHNVLQGGNQAYDSFEVTAVVKAGDTLQNQIPLQQEKVVIALRQGVTTFATFEYANIDFVNSTTPTLDASLDNLAECEFERIGENPVPSCNVQYSIDGTVVDSADPQPIYRTWLLNPTITTIFARVPTVTPQPLDEVPVNVIAYVPTPQITSNNIPEPDLLKPSVVVESFNVRMSDRLGNVYEFSS